MERTDCKLDVIFELLYVSYVRYVRYVRYVSHASHLRQMSYVSHVSYVSCDSWWDSFPGWSIEPPEWAWIRA